MVKKTNTIVLPKAGQAGLRVRQSVEGVMVTLCQEENVPMAAGPVRFRLPNIAGINPRNRASEGELEAFQVRQPPSADLWILHEVHAPVRPEYPVNLLEPAATPLYICTESVSGLATIIDAEVVRRVGEY